MDGIEWQRRKWSWPVRAWFWANEQFGCRVAHHLVADNPGIAAHLATRVHASKITMIPYGAPIVETADSTLLERYQLVPRTFATMIARPEPENSVLEVVRAFSLKRRGIKLVVLGKYERNHTFQRRVLDAAGDEVCFIGAIYERGVLNALRHYSVFYVHGHQVGGTNPSLVEAMGAGNAILAYDNAFNRWVAREGAIYFEDENSCAAQLDRIISDTALQTSLRTASRARHTKTLTWPRILAEYEQLLIKWANVVGKGNEGRGEVRSEAS
jgi:glycosyltransferase involved in cell wall biosynthesis